MIEGDTATVTITKSGGSASASTIYLLTWPYEDIVEGYDYEGFKAGEITFDVGETTKTFSIDTYNDDEDEETEYFYTYLYQNYSDVIAQNDNYEATGKENRLCNNSRWLHLPLRFQDFLEKLQVLSVPQTPFMVTMDQNFRTHTPRASFRQWNSQSVG